MPSLAEIWAKVVLVFRRLGPAGPLAIVAASTPFISGFLLVGAGPWVAPMLRAHEGAGVAAYILIYAVLGGANLMPTWAHSVLGGWAFGFRIGFPAAMAAFGSAAMLAYLIGRAATRDRITSFIAEHQKSKAVYDALVGSGFPKALLIITLLRVPPSSPFALTNLTLAAVRVNPVAFILGTIIGMAPRTGAVVFVAASLQRAFSESEVHWLLIAGIVATIVVLGILGYLANQAIARVTAPR